MLSPKVLPFLPRPSYPKTVTKINLPHEHTYIEPIPLPPPPTIYPNEKISSDVLQVAYTPQQQALLDINEIKIEWLTPKRVKKADTEPGPNKKYYSTEEQKAWAQKLGLKVSGNKVDVYNRIMEKLKQTGRIS